MIHSTPAGQATPPLSAGVDDAPPRLDSKLPPPGGDAASGVPLYLKKGKERRLRFGHPWIFSNEIDTGRSPLRGFEPGEPVDLRNNAGGSIGSAYMNPRTLICARLLSDSPGVYLGPVLLTARLEAAARLRGAYFEQPFYRLVYGESDGLPGLIVDRYGDVLVVQITTAGMERVRADIVSVLVQLFQPRAVLLKNDAASRVLEGLDTYTEIAHGRVPEAIHYEENGAQFEVLPHEGQKTGWYFDHRRNRQRLLRCVPGKRVLDLFSYTGAWGIQCAVAGARSVLAVDSSQPALTQLARHAELNGVEKQVTIERGDVFQVLRNLRSERQRFDIIIADPPAFIRRKKDALNGLEAYRRLNGLAMQLLEDEGMLVSASCSYHLERDKLVEIVGRVSAGIGKRAAIIEEGHQDVDHPVHPALPESNYLKALFVRLTAA